VQIITAARLQSGTAREFRLALAALQLPSYDEALGMAGAGASTTTMKVRVMTVLGKSVIIGVNPSDSCDSVLQVVAEAGLVDGGKTYNLMFGKTTMALSSTMEDNGVADGAELTATPSIVGSI
jgi:hypothetical protein